jgi:hypothetical protein
MIILLFNRSEFHTAFTSRIHRPMGLSHDSRVRSPSQVPNGPRTDVYRLLRWARVQRLTIELAYYPPYQSTSNPIERCWAVLEVYWNGELLDREAAVLGFAGRRTYGGKHPQVSRVDQTNASGVCGSTKEMKRIEHYLQRLPGLETWSVVIPRPGWPGQERSVWPGSRWRSDSWPSLRSDHAIWTRFNCGLQIG